MQPISTPNYTIYFKDWDQLNLAFANGKYSKVIILVDQNTERDCLYVFKENVNFDFEKISITAGEEHKSITTVTEIWKSLVTLKADRKTLLINLGGGVIGDMGGFAASTFMRGMTFIQVPTTLLSMVDASIGGKLGIDFEGVKNLVGLFNDPAAIFIFPQFLKTLSPRELDSGKAEMYKHGLIADREYWDKMTDIGPDHSDWTQLIYTSVQIKNKVVTKDPTEQGIRKILNFGHTIGHAIESLNLDTKAHLLHGEAIVLGMIAESYISYKKGMLSIIKLESILNGFDKKYKFPNEINLDKEKIIALCLKDKKNEDQKILASLLDGLGSCTFNVEIVKDEIIESLDFIQQYLKK